MVNRILDLHELCLHNFDIMFKLYMNSDQVVFVNQTSFYDRDDDGGGGDDVFRTHTSGLHTLSYLRENSKYQKIDDDQTNVLKSLRRHILRTNRFLHEAQMCVEI